jgi:mono/diheme cytochrome c family protein
MKLIGAVLLLVVLGGGAYLYLGSSSKDYADANDAEQVAIGKQAYLAGCAACHGKNLEGQPAWRTRLKDGSFPAPPHDETGHTWHHPDQHLFETTKYGGAAKPVPGFVSNMPGFEGQLSDGEIWAVIAYIKSRWPEKVSLRQERINQRSRQGG